MGGGEGCVQESGWKGVLGILPTPLVVLNIEGIRNTLFFSPKLLLFFWALQKWQLGFFGLFVSLVHNFAPTVNVYSYF